MNNDQQNLWYLGLANYVFAGLSALAGCFPLIHLTFGLLLLTGAIPPPKPQQGDAPPVELIGGLFVVVASIFIVVAWTHAILLTLAGRCLQQRRWYGFCFVMACVQCASVPIGTVIGVLTIIVLVKPEVQALFGVGPPAKQVPPQPYSW